MQVVDVDAQAARFAVDERAHVDLLQVRRRDGRRRYDSSQTVEGDREGGEWGCARRRAASRLELRVGLDRGLQQYARRRIEDIDRPARVTVSSQREAHRP